MTWQKFTCLEKRCQVWKDTSESWKRRETKVGKSAISPHFTTHRLSNSQSAPRGANRGLGEQTIILHWNPVLEPKRLLQHPLMIGTWILNFSSCELRKKIFSKAIRKDWKHRCPKTKIFLRVVEISKTWTKIWSEDLHLRTLTTPYLMLLWKAKIILQKPPFKTIKTNRTSL